MNSIGFNINKVIQTIQNGIGGTINSNEDKVSSLESIELAIDSIPLEYVDGQNKELIKIKNLLLDKDRIKFVEYFINNEVTSSNTLVNKLSSIDSNNDEVEFVQILMLYTNVTSRLIKLIKILELNLSGVSEADVAYFEEEDEWKKKLDNLLNSTRNKIIDDFKKLLDEEQRKIDGIPENSDGESTLLKYKDMVDILGLLGYLKDPILKKESKIDSKVGSSEKIISTKKKKRIIIRLINGITFAQLPNIVNGNIENSGDHFKLFKTLEEKNKAWLDLGLTKYVFGGDSNRLSEFNFGPRVNESPLEEDQLTYLGANKSWILSYVKGTEDGDLLEKDENYYVTKLDNAVLEKEKEIKNYYLSRDFNLGNFGGVQMRPEIKLPLYSRIKLTVTKEDRIKESPLRNILKGLGQIVGSLFSAIPDKGNEGFAQKARARNIAIFNGINSIVRGGVSLVGGKQLARDYDKGISKLSPGKNNQKIKEDMLSVADSPGAVLVNPEAPGQFMQTPNSIPADMDKLALISPIKKKKSEENKKSEKEVHSNKIKSFSDFIGRKSS
jgi:hypothetical protein